MAWKKRADRSTLYCTEALSLLDPINDECLCAYLSVYLSDQVREPVLQALFADVPVLIDAIDMIDEDGGIDDCLKVLEEKAGVRRLKELYSALSVGRDVTFTFRHYHITTGDFVYERRFNLNGHITQRRAALAS